MKIHKILIRILALQHLLLLCLNGYGQIPLEVNVNVFPPYPTQYNIWVSNSANYMITIVNNSDTEFEYYLRASIEGVNANAGTFIRINENYFPNTSKTILPFSVELLTSEDLEDLYGDASVNDLDRSPNVPLSIDGELPEGDYQLCFEVMLYDRSREVFLSPKLCSDVFSVSHGNVQLNYPLDEMVWDLVEVPVPFQWSNITSNAGLKEYEYILKLYELDPLMLGQESIYEYVQSGAVPFYITEPLFDFSFIYDPDFGLPEFIEGNLYAAQVEVIDPDKSTWFDNQNLSNINTFWYGYNPYMNDGEGASDQDMDCFQRCQLSLPANTAPINNYDQVTNFKLGHFTVSDVVPSAMLTGGTFAGTGYVTFDFLNEIKLEVQFSGVTLNNQMEALSGQLTGVQRPEAANVVDEVGGYLNSLIPLDPSILGILSDVCNDAVTIQKLLNGDQVGLPFGIGQTMDGQAFTLAIVGFEATPFGANMDIINILDLTQLGADFRLGLGASDICVAPDGFGNQFKIHLLENASIDLDGGINLTFKGGEVLPGASYDLRNNQSPCYIEMACEGIKAICISGTARFPESMLKKEENGTILEGEPARAYFSSIYERDFSNTTLSGNVIPRTDFIMDFVMDDFQLAKLPGFSFKLQEGSLDFSETRNPPGLEFPEGYEASYTDDQLWQGFYLKTLEVRPPAKYTDGEERSSATIHHILIDPALSMDVEAYHLLPYERGNFKGWGLGIDTFELKILQNTLLHGQLNGKFGAPVFQPDAYLAFNALLDESNSDAEERYRFTARVEPSENLQIPMAIAYASVCQNSYLAANFGVEDSEDMVEVFLKGDLDINTGQIGQTISGNAHIKLADYQLHYNSVEGFIMREEIEDGRGSYFGTNDNEALDCTNLDYTSLQDALDYMMQRMVESGENVFRTIGNELDEDLIDTYSGTWRDGDEMNGLPIRFKKSGLEINDGSPKLSLIVEAQFSPQSIVEAGIILTSTIAIENNKFHFAIENVEIYYTEGVILLNEPVNESALAVTEPLTIKWTPEINDAAQKERLTYQIAIIALDSVEDHTLLDSIFRNNDTFLYQQNEVSGTEMSIDLSDINTILVPGQSYAVSVRGTDPQGDVLNNDGYSNIHIFTWGQTAIVGTNAGNNSACAERCSPSLPENTTAHPSPSTVSSFKMGNFIVETEGSIQQSGQLISGSGFVTIDFLNEVKLEVEFLNVGINEESEAMQGTVRGKKSNPNLLNQVTTYLAGGLNNDVLSLLAQSLDEGRMIAQVMTGGTIDLPFGINVNMNTQEEGNPNVLQIGFTDFNLTPTTSDVDFIYFMSVPGLGQGLEFGLGARDICIAPEGFGNEARIYLTQDLVLPLDGETQIVLNGGQTPTNVGNQTIEPLFLEIDCNGFKALNLSGNITFPSSLLVKEDMSTGEIISDEQVRGFFGAFLEVRGWNAYTASSGGSSTDLLLNFTMDPFQIKGLKGWGFELTQGVLDLSEVSNHPEMTFPENYDASNLPEESFWTGFYLKELKFKPPSNYTESEDSSDRVFFNIQNLLIDPQFSAVFTAQNLLSFEQGNVKGWGISIDSFGLNILQSNLISGGMKGMIGSPVLGAAEQLSYHAIIEQNEEAEQLRFTAVVRPQANIGIPMLAAQAEVCASSYLGFQLGENPENTHLELFLKSNLSIDLGSVGELIPGNFNIAAADFQLKYNTVKGFVMESEIGDGTGTAIGLGLSTGEVCSNTLAWPDFDQMTEDYAQQGGAVLDSSTPETSAPDDSAEPPQASTDPTDCAMNGFPIRLSGFDIGLQNGLPTFSFVVDLALASGGQGFAAGSGLTIRTKKTDNGGKFNIGLKDVTFDCARLAADLDFLKMIGCLCHESGTQPDGSTTNGYFGRVVIQALDEIFIDLQGGFATYKQPGALIFGESNYYGYWYIDGTFVTNTGIPLGPMRLNALGGGVYWNMEPPPLPGHDALPSSPDTGAANATGDCLQDLAARYEISIPNGGAPLGATATRSYGKRAIKLNAGLSFADPSMVILDPLVQVEWTANQGIDEITVGGYLYMLQQDYMSRGAPAAPPTNMTGEPPLEFSSKISGAGSGSRMWISSFNSLYFDRASSNKTLVAFRGTGNFYANILPNILYGSADLADPYRMISHDIYIGHVDHQFSRMNNYQTSGGGSTYWHAYFGNPYDPNMGPGSITFDLAAAIGGGNSQPPRGGSAGLTATMYAMMGHGLPNELPPVPDLITEILNQGSTAPDEKNSGEFDGEPVNSATEREQLSNPTSGFAFGSTVSLQVGFDKIIYASLEVVLGMDLLFQNSANTQCEANGNVYSPPGVANFYGTGQAFAGLKGDVGVRGKILGNEIDVKFLSLAAAMMIQAGGPNPFWIDGRAAISYSVLGGLIKGNARLEVQAGDKCYPYNTNPFTLDVIDKVYPDASFKGDQAADPYTNPRVTFKMPVALPSRPWEAEIQIPVIGSRKNEVRTLAPVLELFTLDRRLAGGTLIPQSGNIVFSESKRSVRFMIDAPLADSDQQVNNRSFQIKMVIKAKEKIGHNWTNLTDFASDTTVVFQASPLKPYIDQVTHTNPIRGQRFFMPGEWTNITNIENNDILPQPRRGMIKFRLNEKAARFYAKDNRGLDCHYDVVFRLAADGEEVHRHTLTSTEIEDRRLQFRLPSSLETSTQYILQIVRRKTFNGLPVFAGGLRQINIQQVDRQLAEQYDVDASYSIEYEEDDSNSYEEVNDNETLLHMLVFRTSKYQTLQEKLGGISLELKKKGTTIYQNGFPFSLAKDHINITDLDEPFEQAELIGHTTTTAPTGGPVQHWFTQPRVQIIEPFKGAFYDNQVKPKVNDLLVNIRTKIDNKDVGLRMQAPNLPSGNGLLSPPTFLDGYGPLGGPSPDLQGNFWDNSTTIVHKITWGPNMQYLNWGNYVSQSQQIYGETSVRLADFVNSQSYFAGPIPQISGTLDFGFLTSGAGITIQSGGGLAMTSSNKNVLVGYQIRERVAQDISNLVNWTESSVNLIRNGTNNIIQTWSSSFTNNYLQSTTQSYDQLVSSNLYSGSAPLLSPTGGNQWTLHMVNPPFTPSNIELYYNTDFIDRGSPQLRWTGSKVIKVVDD